jgi:hypothetical protein
VKTYGDSTVRGYQRVMRRREERRIRISAEPADQILSSQKSYGLWGLFSVPARASGLLIPGQQRLTPTAREFVRSHYFPMYGNAGGLKRVVDLFRRPAFDLQPDGRDALLLEAVARMHTRKLRSDERAFYREHLAHGGPTDTTQGKQAALAAILADIENPQFGFAEFEVALKAATNDEALNQPLRRIECLERLIAPAALLFGFLQQRDRQTVSATAALIKQSWDRPLRLDVKGLRTLQPSIAAALQSQEESEIWMRLADALAQGAYAEAIPLLIAMNAAVMHRRGGGAAWITIEGGRLRVRLRDEPADITSVQEAEQRWRSTYFINALWRVSREIAA